MIFLFNASAHAGATVFYAWFTNQYDDDPSLRMEVHKLVIIEMEEHWQFVEYMSPMTSEESQMGGWVHSGAVTHNDLVVDEQYKVVIFVNDPNQDPDPVANEDFAIAEETP